MTQETVYVSYVGLLYYIYVFTFDIVIVCNQHIESELK